MKIKTIDTTGKTISKEVSLGGLENINGSPVALAKYLRVYNSNQRESNAHTKTRAEVSGGGRKPWKQKGTGRARHGSTRSPIWVGGGVAFGPRNTINYKLTLNKKEKVAAAAFLVKARIEQGELFICDLPKFASTKDVAKYIEVAGIKKSVIIHDDKDLYKYVRNIENVISKTVLDVSLFEIARQRQIIFTSSAFTKFISRFTK